MIAQSVPEELAWGGLFLPVLDIVGAKLAEGATAEGGYQCHPASHVGSLAAREISGEPELPRLIEKKKKAFYAGRRYRPVVSRRSNTVVQ